MPQLHDQIDDLYAAILSNESFHTLKVAHRVFVTSSGLLLEMVGSTGEFLELWRNDKLEPYLVCNGEKLNLSFAELKAKLEELAQFIRDFKDIKIMPSVNQ